MIRSLRVLFAAVFITMTAVTLVASRQRDVVSAVGELWPDPWFRATLADAYFAFLAVWLWVAWRERTWGRRILWLVLFALLGNFAIAGYALWALRDAESPSDLFRRLPRPGERALGAGGP